MRRAIELAHRCPPSDTAYSVGAVIVHHGSEISTGYSRETDQKVHAEEAALAKLPADDRRLCGATLYSTLEPCARRLSRPKPCLTLILAAQIPRVVIAWREPPLFVENHAALEQLREAGVDVVDLPELAADAIEPNAHLDLGP